MKALQSLLTTPHHAKLLAVRRVVQNKGAKKPGVMVSFGQPITKKWKMHDSLNDVVTKPNRLDEFIS